MRLLRRAGLDATAPFRTATVPAASSGAFARAAGSFLLSALLASSAVAAETAAGKVEEVRGVATAQNAAGQRALAPQAGVFIGDDVATGEESRAQLQLGRDTSLRLGAKADVKIDAFLVDAGGTLTIGAGPILLDKQPSRGPVRLHGAFGLITVRGTRIFAGPSKGVIGVFVVHGTIDVRSGGGSVTLHGGEGTDIAAPGARPTPPKRWAAPRVAAALASVN